MKENDFHIAIDRRHTGSIKWDLYKGKDIYPMWVADMDFQSPPAIIKALHERVDHGIFGYTHAPDELVDVIRNMLKKDYGWDVSPEWLVWLPGLVTGLNVCCRAVGNSGDDMLTTVPIYPPFLTAPGFSDRNLVTVEMVNRSGKWIIDFDDLEKAITEKTKLLLLCNPHNPTGRVFSKKELTTLADICEKNNVIICSDEIHCGLILDTEKNHVPMASISSAIADRIITLMAPSKTYNLPGLGFSFAVISNPDLRKSFKNAIDGIVPYVNALGYTAALAAYRNSEKWLMSLLEYLRENRDIVLNEVNRIPGLSMNPVAATYLAWIDCRETGMADPVNVFEKAGVGLSDGREFGSPGFVRLNFGCPRAQLISALDRMKKVCF